MDTPASTVIGKCGGAQAVAKALGIDVSNVHRWTYPKNRGGTGGHVPTKHVEKLMAYSRENSCGLKPEHFFAKSEKAA